MCWSPLTYAVELADRPGRALVVRTNQPHPGNWVGVPAVSVLPATVAAAVRQAIAGGWAPERSGKPFHLDLSEDFVSWPRADLSTG
jgi:hypothetical protein